MDGERKLPHSTPKFWGTTALALFTLAAIVFLLLVIAESIKPEVTKVSCAKEGKVMAEYMHGGSPHIGCVTIK